MTILDTNAVSETMNPAPSDNVLRWLASQDPLGVFVTVITQAEILYGIEILPAGKRKQKLSAAASKLFHQHFRNRILPFDHESAREFAKIVASRKAAGRPISQFDAMIAAIARSRGAAVATRNTGDFEHCGIRLLNPWIA